MTAPGKRAFGFCLNTSTVRDKDGKSRPIIDLIDIAPKAGYDAIEPWTSEIDEYLKSGRPAQRPRKRIEDAGLVVPDAIGFAEWIVEDEARRKKGLEQAKRDMELVAEIGGAHVAAPPVAPTGGMSKRDDPNFTQPVIDLLAAADRYRALLELGKSMGVTPIVEVWGFSKTLRRLGEALLVAAESGRRKACVLPDVYHLYKGGSDFAGLASSRRTPFGIFHVNDYPKIDRDKITDADRVYPGDGIAPLEGRLRGTPEVRLCRLCLARTFQPRLLEADPHTVAKTGLAKTKAATEV